MILINREEVEGMIRHMNRAVGYCQNARSGFPFDPHDEYEPLSRAAFYKAMLRDKVRNMSVNDPEVVITKPDNSNA